MIIFLYGDDSFRSRQKLNELKEKFLREVDPSGNSLTALDGEAAPMEKINEAIGSGTLLAKKRMVIIENIFSGKNQAVFGQILNYLKNKKTTDNIIIFWDSAVKAKKSKNREEALKIDSEGREKKLPADPLKLFEFLAKQKYAQQFNALSNTEAAGWAKKEVEARGGKITARAAQTLISLTGGDLWQASNEINKLLNYKLGREPKLARGGEPAIIEAEDVELLTRGNFDENIFALTDAVSGKNKALAAKLLEEQIEAGLTDSHLIVMIIRQFRILLQIRQALDSGHTSRKMISQLKLHPFIVQKGINQVRNFSLPALKNILNELVKIDYRMKTGQADAKTMLNLLIAKM